MTTTTFVDGTTVIRASWLNDVNTGTYITVPALAASNTGTNTGDQVVASTATIKTGTNNTQIVSPLGVLNAFGFSGYFQSTDQTITAAGALTIAHGLGRTPVLVQGFLKCTTATTGYSIGDITPTTMDSANNMGAVLTWDSTNINIRFGSSASTFYVLNKSTGASAAQVNANWSFFVRVWA